MIGKRVLHYRILKTLGQGGMGEVYLAADEKLDRRVALKTVPRELADDPIRRKRFERESKVLAALNHPNIVTVHAIEEAGGHSFLVMELIEGTTLSGRIPYGGMEDPEVLGLAVPIAEAVAAAHAAGVVHRDLKPDNVMIRDDGLVKVVDFGLSRLEPMTIAGGLEHSQTGDLTAEGHVVGTMHYMSPEHLEGRRVDARSDVFSLGIVLYEMITGSRPFRGTGPLSIATAILRDEPEEPALPDSEQRGRLVPVIRRCLEKNPDRRFQNAGDLRDALLAIRDEMQRAVWASGASREAGPRAIRRPLPRLGIAAVTVGVGLVVVGAWLALDVSEPTREPPAAVEARDSFVAAGTTRRASPEAEAAYLRGRYFLDQRTQEGFQKALQKFREALVLDPEYAAAHAGLAHAYNLMASYKIVPPEEGFARAREAAEAALRLHPENADAHAAMAFIAHYWDWNLAAAEAGFRRALELDPDNPEVHHWLALLLIHTARFDEAVDHALTAVRLAPVSLIAHRNAATVLYFARELERAQQYLEKTRELDPNFSNVHILQGSFHELEGRYEDAEREFLAERALDRGWNEIVDSLLGHLYAVQGQREKALEIARSQSEHPPTGSSPFYVAALWLALGDRDRAFDWLERAWDERDRFLLQLRAEPRFDPLRSDARYLRFLERVGLLVEP
jgi:tetratricopeptide (TPR) repeat protein